MRKESLMKTRINPGLIKSTIIHNILKNNKIAQELFGIEKLTIEELYDMKIKDLRNVDSELRIQIGMKRSFKY